MSRMAAKFTTDPTAASSGVTGNAQLAKPKKFCTRGEEFFDFLKSIGYQPPKHQQFEHFEYLFQDEKSSAFARKLMSTLKPQNRLLPEEIQRFEALEKQGQVLYGADLEEAISRRRAINEMYSVQKHKKQEKVEQLKSDLQSRLEDVERLKQLETIFQNEASDMEVKSGKIENILSVMSHFQQENEKEMEIDLQLLNEKMSDLEQAIVHLKQNSKEGGTNYLCQMNEKLLLEREDAIFAQIQELISQHGKNLIMKEDGYAVEGDPLHEENIRKIFAQFEMDFDRVKHCIIYERVQQVTRELKLAGQRGVSENFEEIYRKAVHHAGLDYSSKEKITAESMERYKKALISFQQEREELLDLVREHTLAAINHQFSALTNIKKRSKVKLQEFFSFITNVLRAQKVRITLISHLIKDEAKLYGRLLNNIEENLAVCNRYSNDSQKRSISGLTLEGQILLSLFKDFGISQPLEILASAPNAFSTLKKCIHEANTSYWNAIEEKNTQNQNTFNQICKAADALKQVNQSASTGTVACIEDAEECLKKRKAELTNYQQTRKALTKERLESRRNCIEKMKNILSTLSKEKTG